MRSRRAMQGRRAPVAAALALASIGLAPASASAPQQAALPVGHPSRLAPCEQPQDHPVLGRACPVPGGWTITTADGATYFTHGPDAPSVADHFRSHFTIRPNKPDCVKSSEQFHNRVFYVYSSNQRNAYSYRKYHILSTIYSFNGLLNQEARERGARRMEYRVLCTRRGSVSITVLKLSEPAEATSFGDIIDGLRARGYANPYAKYWIFHEGSPNFGGGVATAWGDDRASEDNLNNFGPAYAVAWGPNSFGSMMHESAHTLGAVQPSSPNATGPPNGSGGGMHCNDGLDVMCYPDGAAFTNYKNDVCPRVHFDCRHNDYFNPFPRNGTYLATHWNLGSPNNRFMAGCAYLTGKLTVGVPAQDVTQNFIEDTTANTHSVSRSCWGRQFVLSGVVYPPPEWAPVEGRVPFVGFPSVFALPAQSPAPDFGVCWYRGSRLLRCHSAAGTDRGAIPSGATRAKVFMGAGAAGTYVLNAV